MSDFKELSLSEEYLQPYCLMSNYKGLVFVEGLRDISFWDGILNEKDRDINYNIMNVTDNGTKGKTVLKKFMPQANRFAIFAMDSDFDYMCPDNSDDAIAINNNKYVLQTFVYSKESVCLHHSIIDLCLSDIRVTERIDFKIENYLITFSNYIFPLLMAFLYLKNSKKHPDDKLFHSVITPKNPEFNAQYNLINDPFSEMKTSISEHLTLLRSMVTNDNELEKFTAALEEKGLNKNNCYQYINGHHLEDVIVNPLINSLIKKLKENELGIIFSQCKKNPSLIEGRKKELQKFMSQELNFQSIIHNCKEKFLTACALAIKESASHVCS